ncbi:hypothetical protein A4A49_62291, partial [Nicotiana attenuata]
SLTISLHVNVKRRYLIQAPTTLETTSLNIRLDPSFVDQRYVILMIPTLAAPPPMPDLPQHNHLNMQLGMSLMPGGSPTTPLPNSMKIMLWNCRGAHRAEFRHNLHFLLDWNNPTILCLTETRMEDHASLLHYFNFTNLVQVAAHGYSGGICVLSRSKELTVDPLAITALEIHATVQV